jgi:hypothetical protein
MRKQGYDQDAIVQALVAREAKEDAIHKVLFPEGGQSHLNKDAATKALLTAGLDPNDPSALRLLKNYREVPQSVVPGSSQGARRLEKTEAEKVLQDLGGVEVRDIDKLQGEYRPKGNVYQLSKDESQKIKDGILSDPDVPGAVKEAISGFSAKRLLFTYDIDGHGSPGTVPTSFKIFGVSGTTTYRLGSYDNNFKYARE